MESKNIMPLILLMIFDKQQRVVFRKRLSDYGFRNVESCTTGDEALKKLNNHEISLFITDVGFRGKLDGVETCKRIREKYDLPLIYLSGLQDENTFQKALSTQPHAFLKKPVNWNELRIAIESALFRNREKASVNAVMKDVTAQKLAEEALMESERKFKNLIESAGDIIYLLDHDLNYLYANDQCLKRYGLTKKELIGKNYRDFHSNDSSDEFIEKVRAVRKSGKPSIYEHQSKTDGKFFLRTLSPIIDPETEKIESITVISRDITERKQAEEELATVNDRLANNLKSMTRLHMLGTLLVSEDGMDVVLQEMLDVAIAIANADMGNIQLLDRQSESLKIRAHHGFEQPFLDFWDSVLEGQGTCGTALERRERVIVEDVRQSPIFVGSPALDVQLAAGVRAVLSTPLIGRSGKLIGMCSTHFRTPHRPDEQTLHLLDLHARQVGDIIERAQMEETLQESEKFYRKIFEDSPIGMALTDRNFHFLSANPSFCKMLGYTEEEMKTMTFLDITHPDHLEPDRENVEKLLKGKISSYRTEKRYIARNGDIRWGNLVATTIWAQDGKFLHSLAMIEDITMRKQTETKLREILERLDLATSAGNIGIWDLDILKNELVWDDEMYKLFNVRREDFEDNYHAWLSRIHPDDRTHFDGFSKRVRKKNEEFRTEFRIIWPDGNIRYLEAHGKVITDEKGKPLRMIGINIDITEKKKADKELVKSKQMLQLVLDTIPTGVFWKDRDLNYLGANHVFLKDTGMNTSEELTGKNDFDLPWLKEQAGSFRDYDRKIIESGVPEFGITESYVRIDGTSAWARTNKIPIRDAEGNIMGILGTSEDITEQKLAEQALRASEVKFRVLAESAPAAIVIVQGQKIVYANPFATELSGYNINDLLRLPYTELIHPDYQKKILTRARTILEGKILTEMEVVKLLTKKGEVKWISLSAKQVEHEGNPAILAIILDITRLVQVEEELRKSQSRLENAMEIARLGYWEYDVAEDRFTFDDHFYSIFRTTAEKAGGYTMSSARYAELFVHPEDKQVVVTETRKAIETDDPNYNRQLEHRMIFADGSIGYIAVRFFIVKDNQGRTVRTFGANQDITERKKAEKALEESEAMLRSILRTVSVGIGVVKNRVFEWSNETYRNITGFSESELKGKSTRMVYPDDEEFKRVGLMFDLMKKYGIGSIEAKHKHKNGNIIDVLINVAPIVPGDVNSGVAFTLLDITDRKKIEEELYISLEKYRVLFESFPLGITITDKSGQIKETNLESERLLGISRDEHKRRRYDSAKWKITRTDGTPMPSDEYASVRALKTNRKVANVEMGIVKDKGEITWINVTAAPIPLKDYGVAITYNDITKRKITEKELHTSQARFRAFMENLSVMTYMKNKEGKFIYGNKAILRFAGRTSEKYNGTRVTELLPGDLGRWMEQMDKKVLKTMKSLDLGEWRWVKDNRERWFREFKFPISLPDGETIIGGWMMEITSRKTTELALKESEARYRDMVEKAGIAIMTEDADGNITYFNREFARLFGYAKAEMKKQSWEKLIHAGDLEKKISYRKKRMKGEKVPKSYELRGIHKNGNGIWIAFEITVLTEQNEIIGTRNYIRDITNRKKIIEALENSETRYRELVNNMSSGVAVYSYDPAKDDFLFTDINRAGMRISRIKKRKDVINRYLLECFPGARKLGLWSALKRVRKSGIPEKLQNTHYKDDRLDQYLENFVYRLKTGELIAVYDDIGERVLAEQSVYHSYEEIRKLTQHLETVREEERKKMAGELHDELGQILTAIKMDVSWIRDKMPPERKGIKKRTGSTIEIIDEALRSIQRLSLELRPRMLDDLGLIETLRAFFKEYKNWANISVRYNLPEKEPDLIPGQEISVFRIIQESLTNVARHAGATGVKVIIKEKNDNLELKIQDNGIGIPDGKVHSSESFGILNMREKIQGWGGTFEIKGETGKGTTITARLPVGKAKS